MSYTMTCELLAHTHIVLIGHLLDFFANQIQGNSRLADRNCLVESLLSHLCNLQFYFLFRLTIEDCQIVVTVVTVDVDSDVNIELISELKGS